jgi:hypothetical protein
MSRVAVLLVFASTAFAALPPRVDHSKRNTSLKDQGPRGTCFSFATVAALEAAYVRAGYPHLDLSEEFTVYLNRMFCRLNGAYSGARRTQTMLADIDRGHTRHLLAHFVAGFAIPRERDMPYRVKGYTHPRRPAGFWAEQYNVSSFNLDPRNLPLAALTAPNYYAVSAYDTLPPDQLTNPDAYMQVLHRGHEIIIDFHVSGDTKGPVWHFAGAARQKDDKHSMLLVGYDATKKVFLVKNSSDRRRVMHIGFDYLKYVYSASYITRVARPRDWPELAFLGRWRLQAGKVEGILDVYHQPGLSRLANAVVSGIRGPRYDFRLGTFYQGGDPKRAYRVNGRACGRFLEMWFDPDNPNLRPDELTGARLSLKMGDDRSELTGARASAKRLLDPEAFAGAESPQRVGPASRGPFTLDDLAR